MARELKRLMIEHDGFFLSCPEYNSSISSVLKNALDWVSRPLASSPLKGKDVAVLGASTGMFGAVWAQAELRKVLTAMGARVVDRELPVMLAAEAFADDDALADADQHRQLAEHVAVLVEATQAGLQPAQQAA